MKTEGEPRASSNRLVLEEMYKDAQKYAIELFSQITEPCNRHVRCVAEALLQLNDVHDAKAFVLDREILSKFNLRDEYGIDPAPLFNLNDVAEEHGTFEKFVSFQYRAKEEDIRKHGDELVREISQIRAHRLLGKNTEAKLAYVRDISRASFTRLLEDNTARREFLDEELRKMQEATHELLRRQKERLREGLPKTLAVEKMMQKIETHVFRHKLYELATAHPDFSGDVSFFCHIYADEIAQCLGDHEEEATLDHLRLLYKKDKGIEVAYSPRSKHFFTLGDTYGDCTAKNEKRQVELNMTNIHWTVYAWLLDPYYRVLETFVDGDSVMKGHITPLIIRGTRTLALDAIEVVPKMRDTIKNRPNKYLSQRLFDMRFDILNALLETTKQVGERMGVDQVLVEKFSGASWVRETLGNLQPMFYHVSDVEKPFGAKAISALVSEVFAMEHAPTKEEIQFVNLGLAEQGLRYGYKEAGILFGEQQEHEGGIISGP